jgi:MoxR-like ATPase
MSESMKRLIKAALFTPGPKGWGLPLLFWGGPGVAKSDIIEEVARGFGLHVEILSPGERGEGAFGVVPVPVKHKDGRTMLSYPQPDYMDIFSEDERGLIFVDELTTAPRAVKPAMLGLIQARRLGGSYVGQGVRILAAANPVGSSASGEELPKPTANRLGHIEWEAPDAQAWTSWLVQQDAKQMGLKVSKPQSAPNEEKRVLDAWDEAHAKAKGLIAGLIKHRPSLLHSEPADDDGQASRAWPSRRTWDLTTRAIAASAIHGLSPTEEQEFIAAFVGGGAATELFTYRTQADLPDPVAVLEGKVSWKPDEERLDRTMAVLSACSAIVCSPSCANKAQRVDMMWDLLGKLTTDMKDIALIASEPVIMSDVGTSTKKAISVLAKLAPIVQLARRS